VFCHPHLQKFDLPRRLVVQLWAARIAGQKRRALELLYL
jgi:hypothetical protein